MLAGIIKAFIRESGPITVAQFMQLALYDPKHGYYTTKEPFGGGGDFTTAPEISQMFGEMLGLWIADFWQRSGMPKLRIVECGPGRGALMQDLLRATQHVPQLHTHLEVVMVEISPRLIALQQQKLSAYSNICWQPDLTSIAADKYTIILGNEFLDALPIRQYTGTLERRIGLDDAGELCFLGGGDIRETCPDMERILQEAARLILPQGGACLFIDYGYTDTAPKEGTLQAVKAHHYHPLFEDIGAADITALVDFNALAKMSTHAGLCPLPLLTQGLFLERTGIHIRLKALQEKATEAQRTELETAVERLLSPAQMGTLFKVFCATHPKAVIPHAFEHE